MIYIYLKIRESDWNTFKHEWFFTGLIKHYHIPINIPIEIIGMDSVYFWFNEEKIKIRIPEILSLQLTNTLNEKIPHIIDTIQELRDKWGKQ